MRADLDEHIPQQPHHLDSGPHWRVVGEVDGAHGVELRKVVQLFQEAGSEQGIQDVSPAASKVAFRLSSTSVVCSSMVRPVDDSSRLGVDGDLRLEDERAVSDRPGIRDR